MRIFLLVIFLTSCQSNGVKNSLNIYDDYVIENKLQSIKNIVSFTFRGWNSLDNHHLILTSSHTKSYLITLATYCNDLDFSHSIVLDQAINSRLSSKFDSIIIPKQQFQEKCRIHLIHQINKQQHNELTALRKNKQKIKKQAFSDS